MAGLRGGSNVSAGRRKEPEEEVGPAAAPHSTRLPTEGSLLPVTAHRCATVPSPPARSTSRRPPVSTVPSFLARWISSGRFAKDWPAV